MYTRPLALIICLLLVSTTIALAPEGVEAQRRLSSHSESDDGDLHYLWMHDDDLLEVRIKGDITFTADDAAVERMSPDGLLKVEERKGGRRRMLEVRPAADGSPQYTYSVDGRQRAYDAATRDEVGDLILLILRNTGIDADRRVARILAREGLEGVFDEIRVIESGSGKRKYFTALLDQGNLDTAALRRVAEEVAEEISSGGDRARFLKHAAPYYLGNSQVYAAYFDAVNTIPSSGDHARVLKHLLEEHDPDREALMRLLQSARRLASGGDKARVLIAAAGYVASDDDLVEAYLDAAETIGSSGDHSRALSALVKQQ